MSSLNIGKPESERLTNDTVKPRIVRTIRSRNSAHKWGAHKGGFKRNTRFLYAIILFKAFFFKRK